MPNADDYVLRMRGTHMAPEIQPGDGLCVRKQDHADAGQIVIASVNGYATVRRHEPGLKVLGLVTDVYRRIPGSTS